MNKIVGLLILVGSYSTNVYCGTVTACDCKYEGISGDYALILLTYSFENTLLNSRKVGTYFSEMQCRQTAT